MEITKIISVIGQIIKDVKGDLDGLMMYERIWNMPESATGDQKLLIGQICESVLREMKFKL